MKIEEIAKTRAEVEIINDIKNSHALTYDDGSVKYLTESEIKELQK